MDTACIDAGQSSGSTAQKDVFSICSSVLSTETTSLEKRRIPERTVDGLLGWSDDRSIEQRHCTTPVILMDANDGVGLELRNCRHREVDTQCISAAGARREHVTGKRVREMMEKHHMTSALAERIPVDENMSEEQLTTAVAALR